MRFGGNRMNAQENLQSVSIWAKVLSVLSVAVYLLASVAFVIEVVRYFADSSTDETARLGVLLVTIMLVLTFVVLLARCAYVVGAGDRFDGLTVASEALLPERTAVFVIAVFCALFCLWVLITGDSTNVPTELPPGFSSLIASLFFSAPLLEALVIGPHKFCAAMRDDRS